jgi:all-trans-8'-apo-beta-carotenal 15,15'-oxygenase
MTDHAPLLEKAFFLDLVEDSYPVEDIDGELLDFINGTYYINGPARFERGDVRYHHWLDGDGMVCALRIEGGRAHFTNRFVRSNKYVAEEDAGRSIFRAFGTAFEGDQLVRGIALESPVNVSTYAYNEKLLAFGEQGLPWELHPKTLETCGEYNFGGRLNSISPFSAHPKFDSVSGEMFNFGISFSATRPSLNIYRFGADADLVYRKRLPIDYACSIHDFTLSPTYAIFYLSPYLLDMGMLMGEGKTLMDSLSWEPERGSVLRLVSRETGGDVASIPIGQKYCLHLINSFEIDGKLIVDVIEYDQPIYDEYQVVPDLFTGVREAHPVRFVVEPETGELIERQTLESYLAPDFPSIDSRRAMQPYDDFWMLGISAERKPGRKFFDRLLHLSWEDGKAADIYQAPPKHYLGGEPVFVGDTNDETAGVVICPVFDAENVSTAFAVFDAFNVAAGPISTLRLQHPIPLLFHASFDSIAMT